jgi:hypothetical protein
VTGVERLGLEAELLQHQLGRPHRPGALGARPADQPLGEHADQRRRHQERLDPHVDQAGDRAGGVVGVDGREDEVAGQRRGDRDLGGLAVADLADHDHVRIVAQEGAQPAGEGEIDLRVDLGLRDPLDLVLDRILDGEDVELGREDLGQAGVQRGGLAGAGRPGDQQDAVRPLDDVADHVEDVLRHPDVGEAEHHRAAVEEADRHPLAVGGRRGRDAHVDVLAGDLAADAAVLGQPLLGDVEAGHDLDAGQDRRGELLGGALVLAQHAVDPVADHHVLLARLDVDVGGALLDRLEQERVDPADDRRLVGQVEDVDQLLGGAELVVLLALLAGLQLGAGAAQPGVRLVDQLEDPARRRDHRLAGRAEDHRDVVELVELGRVGDRDLDPAVLAARQRHHLVVLGEVDRQAVDQVGRDVVGLGQVAGPRHLGLLGERDREAVLVDQLHAHHDLAEEAALLALLGEAAVDVLLAHAAARDQDLAEAARRLDGLQVRVHGHFPFFLVLGFAFGFTLTSTSGSAGAGAGAVASPAGVGSLGSSSSGVTSYSTGPSGITSSSLSKVRSSSMSASTASIDVLISSIRPRFFR